MTIYVRRTDGCIRVCTASYCDVSQNDFDEIDARKRSSDTAVTSTSSVAAHTLKSPKPKKGGLHSTTRRKSPKNKNGKCDTGKKESKIEIQRGKSTPHGTNNFLTEGAGEVCEMETSRTAQILRNKQKLILCLTLPALFSAVCNACFVFNSL